MSIAEWLPEFGLQCESAGSVGLLSKLFSAKKWVTSMISIWCRELTSPTAATAADASLRGRDRRAVGSGWAVATGLVVSLLLVAGTARADVVKKSDLFTAGSDGYALYRIPGIVVTKTGTILAYCEARRQSGGDWGQIDVMLRRSTDGGKTWLPRQKIVHVEGDLPLNPLAAAQNLDRLGDNTVNNPVAIVDHETGAVHFLYCLEYMRCFSMRSDDDGATWTEPVEITKTFEKFRNDYDWKVLATGPAHGIQLTHGPKRGRLVVPVWLSLGTGGHAHRPSVTATIYSDDHGKTWHPGDIAVPDTPEFVNPNETVVVQLADGSVMLNSRSESKRHRRLVTTSLDGATGWSQPRFAEQLLEPICMAGLVRVREPQADRPGLLAFSNPHNLSRRDGKTVAGTTRDRRNVSIKLSDDEGRTWSANRTLEPGFSGYSDLAVLPDGTILCFYERGSTDGNNHYRTDRLTVARVTEAWVREGVEADVCVYGGTSGGVVAAVQAARMGKRVVLIEPGRHLGGMTSGGLSAVDIGEPRSVGGIAREYFSRLVASYGKTLNWDQPFKGRGGPATGGAYSIEPHVAERVFDAFIREAGVTVLRDARLASVNNEAGRITELLLEDGRTVRAKMFLDTTYEGDLLAAAGVSYTLSREGNARYGETYNGIHYAKKYQPRSKHLQPGPNGRVPGGQGVWDRDFPLDPYLVSGDPTSGLLPLVNEGAPGTPGDPAPGVMAYCFRLCLSTADDRLPIEPPPDYDPQTYELVARFIAACQANGDDMDLRWFSKHDPLPNQKWDFNTATFGGNLPGASWEWPEASYDRRREIAKEIEHYHRGLLHFLATDSRVPENVKADVARFGLPRDEFTDNGGWPHQVYVREGRRMVSDLVLTEHHTFGRQIAAQPIGLGSYGTDIHEIRRIVKDGVVIREGKVAGGRGGFGPYQIGYGAIVPKRAECENLFATFAVSASHSAFASIRMEPVFMVTSQSAATAACLAIDQDVAVQKVDYEKLKSRLLADGQVLAWPPTGVPTSGAVPRTIVRAGSLPGIVLDDDKAEYRGAWTTSNRQPSPIGASYRHDDNKGRGEKVATFTATIPKAGEYEIRLLFTWHENRSSRTKVTVTGADEEKTVRINQRKPAMKDRVPNALGIFRFHAGAKASVSVSNEGADGYVVVDALQILPAELAREERDGKRPSGYARIKMEAKPVLRSNPLAARVAFSPLAKQTRPTKGGDTGTKRSAEPVHLKQAATAEEVAGKAFDVVVIGGTGGGVACAVRAAREGCGVLLVQHNRHVGGMMTNGLMQWDALYGGPRSPLFSEMLQNIERYYIETFGRDSTAHQTIRCTHEHYPISWAEPHVAEREYNRLLAAEANITLLLDHYPTAVAKEGRLIRSVALRTRSNTAPLTVRGTTFIDATYEGDLFAVAGVGYRVGREARDEYGEPHAGKVFTNIDHSPPASVKRQGLNIRSYGGRQGSIDPASPFTADGAVQAYNYRFCVTSDPANRIPIPKPVAYDREQYVNYHRKYIAKPNGPNHKSHVNSPILPGKNHDYPDGDWETRDRITRQHLEFGLGLMWFLQHDESIPLERRRNFQMWGLPKDEYADNGHVPYEMYVRETRRIVGRHVLTEHDGSLAAGHGRTPIHPDSIAITDWYMDSHSCTTDSRPGFRYDGKLILTEQSRPSQIPYRSLVPQELDNLLVPVCLSATHIAWGAIRLEPVFLQTGEAAGFAASLAKRQGIAVAQLDADLLVRTLVQHQHLVSFFNDLKVTDPDPVIPAAQYFAAKGFFHSYDAAVHEPLSERLAKVWGEGLAALLAGRLDHQQLAVSVAEAAADTDSPATGRSRGEELRKMWKLLVERHVP